MYLWLPKQQFPARKLCRVSFLPSKSYSHLSCFYFYFSIQNLLLIHSFSFFFLVFVCCSPNSPYIASVVSGRQKSNNLSPLVQCTSHMCPVRIHWHVKLNYKEYWRVKVTITNFNYRMNYSMWNLVLQHPNFDNLTQIFSFNYKPLTPYQNISKLYFKVHFLFHSVSFKTLHLSTIYIHIFLIYCMEM